MAWPIYSARFLRVTTANTWTYYTVPWGYVGVLKSISGSSQSSSQVDFNVTVGEILVWRAAVPGWGETRVVNLHQVAYEGERLGGINNGGAGALSMAGYLLKMPAGTAIIDVEQEEGPPPAGWASDPVVLRVPPG